MAEQNASGESLTFLREGLGKLTRELHEALKDLGVNETLNEIAVEIPDARNRLKYVTSMCERSAKTVLDELEALNPLQEVQQARTREALALLDGLGVTPDRPAMERLKELLTANSRDIQDVQTRHTSILLAQDFQDLTGQVCRKIEAITERVEQQLLALLVATVPEEQQASQDELQGPQVVQGKAEAVSSQSEVDDLLSSLGF